ncbi:MAG: HAMP domain-containing histidine kinase [Symploca sp. SIO2B6]|nr:HAMP domain-containing histidine kinase [Symploca sp. SIO2B6]
MLWNYLIVLSLGILLGWRVSRFFAQLTTTLNSTDKTPNPSPSASPAPSTLSSASPSPSASPPPTSSSPTTSVSPAPLASPDLALQLTADMAHQLGQYKAGFLARTSHELRSPLNRVMSLQQLILADLCDDAEEEREFTRQAYEAAQELLKLLDQTTNISKLSHGTIPLQMVPLSLLDMLAELDMQTRLHAQNRNLRLSIDLPDDDIMVMADLPCLRQVLINLVTTPIYLMQEGKVTVTHTIDTATKMAKICIEDERPASSWSEPVDLLQTDLLQADLPQTDPAQLEKQANEQTNSPSSSVWGLSLITTTQLMQLMHGTLDILETPVATPESKTRIQCSLPLTDGE